MVTSIVFGYEPFRKRLQKGSWLYAPIEMTDDLSKGLPSPAPEKKHMLVGTVVFVAGACASILILAVGAWDGHITVKFIIGLLFIASQSYINIALPSIWSPETKSSPEDPWELNWSLVDAIALRVLLLFSIYLAIVRPSLHAISIYTFILPMMEVTQLLCFFALVRPHS